MAMIRETMLKRLLLPKIMAGGGGGAPVQATATGNPVVFETDLARPLKSLLVPFLPVQSGSGDPSPQNIRPIGAWDGVIVDHCGENLYGANVNESFTQYKRVDLATPIPAGTYTFTATVESTSESNNITVAFAKEHNVLLAREKLVNNERGSFTFTVDDEIRIIYLYADVGYSEGAGKDVKYSGILITSEAPTETDISFPSTVYGGTLDVVAGVLTVEWVCYDLSDFTWEEYTTNRVRSDYLRDKPIVYPETPNDYPEVIAEEYIPLKQSGSLASNHNGLIIMPRSAESAGRVLMYFDGENYPSGKACFKLATPQEITLTPAEQIRALKGTNTIWTDGNGDIEVTYLKKAQ